MPERYCRGVSLDAAAKYDLFTGRFSGTLAREFVEAIKPRAGTRVLDVGCGPGALTGLLVDRVGAPGVAAVDLSEAFVEAARSRLPDDMDVRLAFADALPFEDNTLDAAVAQLVVQFMPDPVAGLRDMARVTRSGGLVGAGAPTGDCAIAHPPQSPVRGKS